MYATVTYKAEPQKYKKKFTGFLNEGANYYLTIALYDIRTMSENL